MGTLGMLGTIGKVALGVGGAILAGKSISSIFDGWSSYSPKASGTESSSKSNADMLAEMKAEVQEDIKKMEKQSLAFVNQSIDALLKDLKRVNEEEFGGKSLNINMKEIERKNDALRKEVIGFVGSYMDSHLVLSDHGMAEILKESDDKIRKRQFDAYCKKLQEKAIEQLKRKVENTVHEQEKLIRDVIQNRLAEVDKNMQAATNAYEEIRQMKEKQEGEEIEKKQIMYCYQHDLAEILLGQLESQGGV